MCLGPLYVLLGEVSVQALCLLLNWVVCLPGVWSCELVVYCGDQTLVRGVIGRYIFPYGWFPFHFADVFIFDEVLFVYSSLDVPCSRGLIGENIAA